MKSALALKVRSFSLAGVSIQFHITFAISSCMKREGWKQSSCSQEKCVCVCMRVWAMGRGTNV